MGSASAGAGFGLFGLFCFFSGFLFMGGFIDVLLGVYIGICRGVSADTSLSVFGENRRMSQP